MQKFIHSGKSGGFAYCYLAPAVDTRIAELERALQEGREAMRDLWRLEPSALPCDALAERCKQFMGGG